MGILSDSSSKDKCKWTYDDEEGCWHTSCKNAFVLTEGTPIENRMAYCPYCGQKIESEKPK